MSNSKLVLAILPFLGSLMILLVSCGEPQPAPPTTPTPEPAGPIPGHLVITNVDLQWPEFASGDCLDELPDPVISLCVQNQGEDPVELGPVFYALPGVLDPEAHGVFIVDSMPGEDALAELAAQGIVIVDSMPGEDALAELAAKGIIVICMPGEDALAELAAKGIIIICMPGEDALAELAAQGIVIIDDMPAANGGAQGIIVVDTMPGGDGGTQGIIVVDTMPGGDGGTQGIIVVDTMPGGDGGAQGIIIICMPATNGGAQGIAIIDSMPGGEDFGAGLMPLSGDLGFGPGVFLLGSYDLTLLGLPAILGPGEEGCITVDAASYGALWDLTLQAGALETRGFYAAFQLEGPPGMDESTDPVVALIPPPPPICRPTQVPRLAPTPIPTPTRGIPPTSTPSRWIPTSTPTPSR